MANLVVKYDTEAPTLRRFMACQAPVQAVMGPVGSGKTAAFVFKCLKLICSQAPQRDGVRRSRGLITRNTYADLMNTTIRDWREVITDDCGKFTTGHPPEHKLRFVLEDGTRVECDVIFIALDRPEHIKKLRGMQVTWAWMNEAKEQPKAVLDMLTLRVGRYPRVADGGCTWDGVLMDYNAPDTDHWIFELEEKARAGELVGYEFFIQPGGVIKVGDKWVPNPDAENLCNLKRDYYVQGMQGKTLDYIKVNLGNQYGFIFDGKPVHPDYNDAVHCWHEPLIATPGLTIIVGMDYGLTPAAVFEQKQTSGRWHVLDELVATDMGAERFAEELHAKCAIDFPDHKFKFVGDPSGDIRVQTDEETVQRVLRANKIPALAASTNDVVLRRAALTRPLTRMIGGRPGIIISPKAKKLRKALQGGWCYRRKQISGSTQYHTEAEKNEYSHVGEACEYGLLDAGEKATIPATDNRFTAPIVIKTNWSPHDRR